MKLFISSLSNSENISPPLAYSKYLYLDSNNADYFDTGFVLDDSQSFLLQIKFKSTNTLRVFRSWKSDSVASIQIGTETNQPIYIDGSQFGVMGNVFDGLFHEIIIKWNKSTGLFRSYLDGAYLGQITKTSFITVAINSMLGDLGEIRDANSTYDYFRIYYGDYEDADIINLNPYNAAINYDFVESSAKVALSNKNGLEKGLIITNRNPYLNLLDENEQIIHSASDVKFKLVVIAGQSNTLFGYLNRPFPTPQFSNRVRQYGRHNGYDKQVIAAKIPLDSHTTANNGGIGPFFEFANQYVQNNLADNETLIVLHGGEGGTGFYDNRWNIGDDLYEDVLIRSNEIAALNPNTEIVCFIWHQGENDVTHYNQTDFRNLMLLLIDGFRNGIIIANLNTPFLIGEMVPRWVDDEGVTGLRHLMTENHEWLPAQRTKVGFVSARIPTVIEDVDADIIHYDYPGQIILGGRYYEKFNNI